MWEDSLKRFQDRLSFINSMYLSAMSSHFEHSRDQSSQIIEQIEKDRLNPQEIRRVLGGYESLREGFWIYYSSRTGIQSNLDSNTATKVVKSIKSSTSNDSWKRQNKIDAFIGNVVDIGGEFLVPLITLSESNAYLITSANLFDNRAWRRLDVPNDISVYITNNNQTPIFFRNQQAEQSGLRHGTFKKIYSSDVISNLKINGEHEVENGEVFFEFESLNDNKTYLSLSDHDRDIGVHVYSLIPQEVIKKAFIDGFVGRASVVLAIFLLIFAALIKINRQRVSFKEELDYRINHDELTGLVNREGVIKTFTNTKEPKVLSFSGVVYIDLDRFKAINDTFGSSTGDKILKRTAEKLSGYIREKGVCARLESDRFLVILNEGASFKAIENSVRRIHKLLNSNLLIGNFEINLSVSVGYTLNNEKKTLEQAIKESEIALKFIKRHNKGQPFSYSKRLNVNNRRNLILESELNKTIDKEGFELHYQPKINLKGNGSLGVEALIRWHDDSLGFVSPAEFIPMAEELNIMHRINFFVIENAVADISSLSQSIDQDVSVSVNLSPSELYNTNLPTHVKSILNKHQFPPRLLTLEITETSLLKNFDEIMPVVDKLRDIGVGSSLDDFGTGYSSIAMLQNLPVTEIKIDKSFIDCMFDGEFDRAIIVALVGMAHSLQVNVVAEGVEKRAQETLLEELGCDFAQGYLYSKPVSKDCVLKYYRKLLQKSA
jgi:diguanylate cyclase (GGDEF)-like protein